MTAAGAPELQPIPCQLEGCPADAQVYADMAPIARIAMCRACAERHRRESEAMGLRVDIRELPAPICLWCETALAVGTWNAGGDPVCPECFKPEVGDDLVPFPESRGQA